MSRSNFSASNFLRGTPLLTGTLPITIGAWCLPGALAAEAVIAGVFLSSAADARQQIALKKSSANQSMLTIGNGTTGFSSVSGSTFSSATVWSYFLCIYKSSTESVTTLNGTWGGAFSNPGISVPSTSLDRFSIGAQDNTAIASPVRNLPSTAAVAHVAIWNVDLLPVELQALAAGASPLLIRPASLVGYWPMIGGYSPDINLVGSGSLTLQGSPSFISDGPPILMPRRRKLLRT